MIFIPYPPLYSKVESTSSPAIPRTSPSTNVSPSTAQYLNTNPRKPSSSLPRTATNTTIPSSPSPIVGKLLPSSPKSARGSW